MEMRRSVATALMLLVLVVPGCAQRPGAPEPAASPAAQAGWRWESYGGVEVSVPADWGWGVAPTSMSFEPGEQYLCGGPGALVDSEGRHRGNPVETLPWVGRPNMASDLCLRSSFPDAKASYVWLGAAIEPGTVDVGNGYTQETVDVAGTTLTVIHTPGHAPGAVCLHAPDLGCVFTGDTLFHGGPGATGRSYSDRDVLVDSIREKLFALPGETVCTPGTGRTPPSPRSWRCSATRELYSTEGLTRTRAGGMIVLNQEVE